MTEAQVYIEVAEPAVEAGEAALERAIQEKAGFMAYHAFESAGGAFCRSRGTNYPRAHAAKINVLAQAVRRERFAQHVVRLAIELRSLRNLLLYPRALQNGQVERPRSVITEAQARRLLGRVDSLVERIKAVV
jgi:hypothetical protein